MEWQVKTVSKQKVVSTGAIFSSIVTKSVVTSPASNVVIASSCLLFLGKWNHLETTLALMNV